MYADTCTEARYDELTDVRHEFAQVVLEFERIVLANCVPYADLHGTFRCPSRDGFGKAFNAVV